MRRVLSIVLLLVGLAAGREMIYPPTNQYFIHPNGQATIVAYKNWKIFSPDKFQVDALITELDHHGALLWMIKGYGDGLYDLRDFAALSRRWTPRDVPTAVKPEIFSDDPNTTTEESGTQPDLCVTDDTQEDPNAPGVAPVITFRISATTAEGGVYHLPSCRYVTETSRTITIEQAQAYRPCKVCRPDELDALLAEFLPGCNHEGHEEHEEKMENLIIKD